MKAYAILFRGARKVSVENFPLNVCLLKKSFSTNPSGINGTRFKCEYRRFYPIFDGRKDEKSIWIRAKARNS